MTCLSPICHVEILTSCGLSITGASQLKNNSNFGFSSSWSVEFSTHLTMANLKSNDLLGIARAGQLNLPCLLGFVVPPPKAPL